MKLVLFFRYSIVSYNLISAFLSYAQGLKNCSDFKEPKPEITIYEHGGDNHLPFSESVENNDKSSMLRRQIKCVHSSPIEWVVDINPRHFDMRRNIFWKNDKEYSAYMVFMFSTSTLQDSVLFSCQPINMQDECERHFLEVTPGGKAPTFLKTSVLSSRKFEELAEKLQSPLPSIGNKSYTDCEMTLNLKEVNNNHLEYKWETRTGSKLKEFTKSTHQPTYFRGMYRHLPQERKCIKFLGQNETCENCKRVNPDSDTTILNSGTFYAKSEFQELVFKGVFNISSDQNSTRKFYLDWDLPLEEMIYLEAPSIFYVNHTITVNCSVSVLYFAYGSNLLLDDKIFHEDLNDQNETYSEDGRRIVSKSVKFLTENSQANIHCLAPLLNFTQNFTKSQTVSIEIPIAPNFNGSFVNETETLLLEKGESGRILSCEVSGNPLPKTVEWTFPSSEIENKMEKKVNLKFEIIQSQISFPPLTSDFIGTYKCIASNNFGTISKSFNIQLPSEALSKGVKIAIGSTFGMMTLILITVVFLIYRKIIIQRQEYRTKTAEAIEEFKKGINYTEVGQAERKRQHHNSIFEQPYNDEFEIPSEKWDIEGKFLGQGAYGIVRKGTVEIQGKSQEVAVKMLKSSVEIEDFKAFLFELKIMAYIGRHQNVVNLVAACTQNIDHRDIMIGVEFCSNGSLLDYLQNKRSTYQFCETSFSEQNFVARNELDLYIWSYQIANGMEFLGSKKVLHGDLATRNVLLSFDNTAKISDFGLSRVLLDSANYTKKSQVALPWKWMAIESLRSRQFSSSSDVWAFGVTLWEIFSLGEAPYAGLHFSPEFLQQLEQGLRLPKPNRATESTYNIMNQCWNNNPSDRAGFSELKSAFAQILENFNNLSSSNEMPNRPMGHIPVPLPRRRNNEGPFDIEELYANISKTTNFYSNC